MLEGKVQIPCPRGCPELNFLLETSGQLTFYTLEELTEVSVHFPGKFSGP